MITKLRVLVGIVAIAVMITLKLMLIVLVMMISNIIRRSIQAFQIMHY